MSPTRKGIRLVIELKKGVIPQVVLNNLYKYTSLQTTFGANNLALVNGVPNVSSLREMLQHTSTTRSTSSPAAPASTLRRPRPARISSRVT